LSLAGKEFATTEEGQESALQCARLRCREKEGPVQ
jgi:hypothetical protein